MAIKYLTESWFSRLWLSSSIINGPKRSGKSKSTSGWVYPILLLLFVNSMLLLWMQYFLFLLHLPISASAKNTPINFSQELNWCYTGIIYIHIYILLKKTEFYSWSKNREFYSWSKAVQHLCHTPQNSCLRRPGQRLSWEMWQWGTQQEGMVKEYATALKWNSFLSQQCKVHLLLNSFPEQQRKDLNH